MAEPAAILNVLIKADTAAARAGLADVQRQLESVERSALGASVAMQKVQASTRDQTRTATRAAEASRVQAAAADKAAAAYLREAAAMKAASAEQDALAARSRTAPDGGGRSPLSRIPAAAAAPLFAPAVVGVVSLLAQATAGAVALGAAVGGVTVAFGALGYAVGKSISSAVTNNAALIAAQRKYQQALQSGSKAQIASARANLQAAQQAVAAQGSAATQIAKDWTAAGHTMTNALQPAIKSVEQGLSGMLQSIRPALAGLSGPFLALGNQIRSALDDPAVQGAVKQLIYDFGRMVRATAPLAGPILQGIIQLADVLIHVAQAAMPDLVKYSGSFANHMAALNAFTTSDKFRSMIHQWDQQFVAVVHTVGILFKALGPLFSQKSAIGKGFLWVVGMFGQLLGAVIKLTSKMGVLGQVIGAGLGLALLAGRLSGVAGAFKAIPGAVAVAKVAITGFSAFVRANPLALPFTILAGAIALALTHMKEFKRGAAVAWDAIQKAFGHGVSFILGLLTTFLHALGSVLNAISNVPGLGWVGNLAKDVNSAGDSIDRLRNKLDGLGSTTKAVSRTVNTAWGSAAETFQRGIQGMLRDYGDFHDKVGATNASLQKNFSIAYKLIEEYIKTHTGAAKKEGEANLQQLQLAFGRYMNESSHTTKTSMDAIQGTVNDKTREAQQQANANMQRFQQDVKHWLDTAHNNTSSALTAIAGIVGSKTQQADTQGSAHLHSFQANTLHWLNTAHSNTATNMGAIASIVGSKSAQAADEAKTNFMHFASNVHGGMLSGASATYKGIQYISGAVSKGLSSLGSAIKINVSLSIPKFAQGGEVTKAATGLYQFGQAGGHGRDDIPVNFGGRGIMVGSGEMGAVFTHQQQAVADRALAPIGGLKGLFSNVTAPHYMAAGGYVYPYPPGTGLGRTDQGVDTGVPPGGLFRAMGDALIQSAGSVQGWGGPYMSWRLNTGPAAGRYVYLAEQIRPLVHPGQRVSGNTAVAVSTATSQEMGWQTSTPGLTLARATSGYTEGQVTPAGLSFRSFIGGGKVGPALLALANIIAPHVKGGGYLGKLVQAGLNKDTSAANKFLMAHMPVFGPGSISPASPSTGPVWAQMFHAGTQLGLNKAAIAGRIGNSWQESGSNPSLNVGGGKGLFSWNPAGNPVWAARVQLGNVAQQMTLASEELLSAGLSIGAENRAAASAAAAATWFESNFEHADPSKANMPNRIAAAQRAYAQGYAKGGFLPFAGNFAGGGIVPGPIGAPMGAVVHGGETISSNTTGGPLINIEEMNVHDSFDERALAHKLAFLLDM